MLDRTGLREAFVAVTLAGITGYIDAIGFTRLFGVFPANQTGNMVFFGIALGEPRAADAWRPGLSMAAFATGVALGVLLAHYVPPRRRQAVLLTVETALLVVVAAIAGGVSGRTTPFGGSHEVVILTCAAIAMGVQTDVIRRAAQVGVWTTFTTGAMVQITDELTEMIVHDRMPSEKGRRIFAVVGTVLLAYVGGAAVGEAVVDAWGHALWLAPAVSAALAIWAYVVPPRSVPDID